MSEQARPAPVPYDPELTDALEAFRAQLEFEPLTPETIPSYRERFAGIEPSLAELVGDLPIDAEERVIPGPAGNGGTAGSRAGGPPAGGVAAGGITLTILRPRRETCGAGIYSIHSGGMILGSRLSAIGPMLGWVAQHGVVGVSVEYRLAPEHPGPAQVEDCYAGLVWFAEHAAEFGVDPERILVMGVSAGGGLSAGVSLLARDRNGPKIAGQMLLAPMLDDRNDSVSAQQYDGIGIWDRSFNYTGWNAILGERRRGTDDVSPYVAPARATDLSGLPPALVDAGAAEVFRDEAVAYASRIWAAGGRAELYIWDGGFHGSNGVVPGARVSRSANAAQAAWIRRILRLPEPEGDAADDGGRPGMGFAPS